MPCKVAYINYMRKIAADPQALLGALKAAVNIADINRVYPDSELDRQKSGKLDAGDWDACMAGDNCRSDSYVTDEEYGGRGMLLSTVRRLDEIDEARRVVESMKKDLADNNGSKE